MNILGRLKGKSEVDDIHEVPIARYANSWEGSRDLPEPPQYAGLGGC